MYPCSLVCRSSMKLITARSSRAPRPFKKAKRAPVTFPARSKSKMPSSTPKSQWGLGSKSNWRGSPQRLTSTFSASVGPMGTEEWGMLGILRSRALIRSLSSRVSPSSSLIRSETSLICSMRSPGSWPFRLYAAISWDALFRWARSSSTSARIRRCFSSRVSTSSKGAASSPRLSRDRRTKSGSLRISLKSSITEPPLMLLFPSG